MINQIGANAGAVWKYLNEHPEAKPNEIKKALKLEDDLLWMAIGWLAREGKVVFSGAKGQTSIACVPVTRGALLRSADSLPTAGESRLSK